MYAMPLMEWITFVLILPFVGWVFAGWLPKSYRIPVRFLLFISVAVFCAYGFYASFDFPPGPNAVGAQIGYGSAFMFFSAFAFRQFLNKK